MKPKNPAAQELGKLGGTARAKKLSSGKRTEIAKKAAQARWKDHKKGESNGDRSI